MVEGPGATRNARKLQLAVGCVVVPSSCDALATQLQQQQQQFIPRDVSSHKGNVLIEAFSVGKEVFLIFSNSDSAMRLHFGMNGSLALSQQQQQQQQTARRYQYSRQPLSLQMKFQPQQEQQRSNGTTLLLECFGTSVSRVSVNVARSKRARLQSLDVCNSTTAAEEDSNVVVAGFDRMTVLKALRTRPHSMISDALLDQNRYPGVGKILHILMDAWMIDVM